ncbi:MAG: hypothetical protein IPF99_42265 [Deltaproteobacteria bacterium]|nr:hypothetical protein [Deltaproteobacteria bacterium]
MRASRHIGWMAALLLVSSAGCATFIRGNTTTVTVRSDAPGAEVVDNGTPRVTPFAMALDHTVDHDVVVRLGAAGWVVLDFFATGIIGIAVDAVTGAWRALSPESISRPCRRDLCWLGLQRAPSFVAPDPMALRRRAPSRRPVDRAPVAPPRPPRATPGGSRGGHRPLGGHHAAPGSPRTSGRRPRKR